MDSSVFASVVFLGILPLVCSVPVLEDGINKDDPLWDAAADGDDVFCKQRLDGVYRDPLSCSLYHRCSGGRRQTLRCGSTLQFDAETGRCEASRPPCVTHSTCALHGDGVYANRSDACNSYYRCKNGSVSESGSCEGRRFDEASQRCETSTSTACVELLCPSGAGGRFYPTPGAACRGYYRCHEGLPASFLCPEGFSFDADSQACTQRATPCPEPVCVGRVNGRYAAPGCSRWYLCEGGVVRAVGVCAPGLLFDGAECRRRTDVSCPAQPPPPMSASAKVAAAASRACLGLRDGAHADVEAGCRDYVLCAYGRVSQRRRCPESTLFDGRMCVPSPLVACPAPRRPADPCARLDDGFHHDLAAAGCGGYRRCAAGRTTLWGRCGDDAVWDGERCVGDARACAGPEPWPGCREGLHRDPDDCRRYHHCGAGNRTRLLCPRGRVFDGRRCVGGLGCNEACAGRRDGYYRDPQLGCRSYFYCSDGHKITYVCPGSTMFDGERCVDAASYSCPFASDDCRGLADGYHPDAASACRSYFYCIDGYKITALTCSDGKVFDGRRCVEPSSWSCPAAAPRSGSRPPPAPATPNCASADGFFQDLASGCRSYYFCIGGAKTLLRCPGGEVFDGQLCVNPGTYSCPTATPTPCKA